MMNKKNFNIQFIVFILLLCLCTLPLSLNAQVDSTSLKVVVKNDGVEYVGVILSDDGREVLLRTKDLGDLYIPKHEIASINAYDAKQFRNGEFVGDDLFATRYVFTTNGLPMKKGDNYMQLNLWGPDFHFGVAKNFNIGVMTSWVAAPIILSAKGSIKLSEKVHLGLGALAGWGGPWFALSTSGGALPFASITTGDKMNNFSINGGYLILATDGFTYTTPMVGLAGLARISKRTSFVFDSFVLPVAATNGITVIAMPGLRFQSKDRYGERAFGFNLTVVYADGNLVPVPIPSFTWFVKL